TPRLVSELTRSTPPTTAVPLGEVLAPFRTSVPAPALASVPEVETGVLMVAVTPGSTVTNPPASASAAAPLIVYPLVLKVRLLAVWVALRVTVPAAPVKTASLLTAQAALLAPLYQLEEAAFQVPTPPRPAPVPALFPV